MAITPMMEQYNQFKNQYPDKIVLFRMGDFFETFGDDAKLTAKILNITLTARDRSADPTPLAGFPHHALNQYLPKIIDAGYCAVIVDQIEDPKLAKGIVKRAVTRVVTPSTMDIGEDTSGKKQLLGAFFVQKKEIFISFLDIGTGEFIYTSIKNNKDELANILSKFEPVEALIFENEKSLIFPNIPVQLIGKEYLNVEKCVEEITGLFKVKNIEGLGLHKDEGFVLPIAMSISYVKETQKVDPVHIQTPKKFNLNSAMTLDRATINNLELVRSSYSGSSEGSLFGVIDKTKTILGKRLLYSWILSPLIDEKQINERLKIVQYFVGDQTGLTQLRQNLEGITDIQRLVGKIGMNRLNARDLKALEYSLEKVLYLSPTLSNIQNSFKYLVDSEKIEKIKELIKIVSDSIVDTPPLLITQGHIIKPGFNNEIDELLKLSGNGKGWIKEFEEKEKERTGIGSLKISFTKVFGYYIEITNTHKEKVPTDYIRKQTLVNAERYITEELKEKEELILTAQDKLNVLEYNVFQNIRNECLKFLPLLIQISTEVAMVDVLSSFSYLAIEKNYVKPKVLGFGENNGILEIKDGRHPVVENLNSHEFVSNDTMLDQKGNRMTILTGPNMSGKSTYIRQIAIIVLLAQIGCFVPAQKCSISLVDRIFTRVGASDELSRGRSTFMVEMDEAANIVNNATKYSLIILDEIGRGTSTYDGVSIAWSLAEYLTKEIKARTLFATHYHELLKLPDKLGEGVVNFNVLVEENIETGEVIFLRKIVKGGTDRSYGIYVAQMAGLPEKVITRAKEILEGFEQESMFSLENKLRDTDISTIPEISIKNVQIPLFEMKEDEMRNEINDIDLDNLTPLEALNIIGKWKKKIK
jgi:DNA mismatch repair protein MutS